MPVAGLLLAAGAGRRMGRPKALVALDGRPLVSRALEALRGAGLAPRVVVLGAAADEVRAVVAEADPDAVVVVAPEWGTGMGASLRAGLAALPTGDREPDAVLVHLVDTPGIGPEALARVARAGGRSVLARGTYGGAPGHPVLLGADHLAGVAAAAHDDVGARGYLAGRDDDVVGVEVGDVAARQDVDTPADLARAGAAAEITEEG